MKSSVLFVSSLLLALSCSIPSFSSTVPILTVVSPVAVSSGGSNTPPYNGPSPVHFVAYATSPNCTTGIAAMRIYSSNGVLAYSTPSSFLDEQLTLSPGSYNSKVEVTDNCGGVSSVNLQENVNPSTGQITVSQPISNLPYQPKGLGITINATATTTCPEGVEYMSAYVSGNRVGRQKGNMLNTGAKLPVGTYSAQVEENDNCGGSTSAPFTIVVQDDGLPLAIGVFQFAYMPNTSTGTVDEFYIPLADCTMTPVFGNPSPAGKRPWAVARNYPYLFALNRESQDISIYEMDLNVSGELTQIPGSPFPLQEASGYTPTGIVVPGSGTLLGIYVTNSSSDPAMPGTLSEFTFDLNNNTVTPMAGSPLVLKGNVQPTGLFVGPEQTENEHLLFTANGSSISVLSGIDTGTRYEITGSPFAAPGRYGPSAGVQDMAQIYMGSYPGYLYTANSENSISAFQISGYGTLTQLPGSPYADPDDPQGTQGNPASVTAYGNGSTGSYLYALDSGSRDIAIFSLNANTGIPTYVQSQHQGILRTTPQDRLRLGGGELEVCLDTSNGYAMLVDSATGLTTLEPGSPFLGPGIYPAIDVGMF
jgi:hypothetical protein